MKYILFIQFHFLTGFYFIKFLIHVNKKTPECYLKKITIIIISILFTNYYNQIYNHFYRKITLILASINVNWMKLFNILLEKITKPVKAQYTGKQSISDIP